MSVVSCRPPGGFRGPLGRRAGRGRGQPGPYIYFCIYIYIYIYGAENTTKKPIM